MLAKCGHMSSFRGASAASEPGIQGTGRNLCRPWIPGLLAIAARAPE